MSATVSSVPQENPTGLEDVVRSVRGLTRTTRRLAEDSADVLEREVAMAIRISEQIRDSVFSNKSLDEARRSALPERLRRDAHNALDVAADAAAIVYLAMVRFVEAFVDERRPLLAEGQTEKKT